MKKSTKGALSAAAAGTLLLGGAGSFAFWSDSATVTGGSLSSGQLKFTSSHCDADWTLDSVGGGGGLLNGRTLVPGDTVTKDCAYTITAVGDHLKADLNVANGPQFNNTALANALDTTGTTFELTPPGEGSEPIDVTPGTVVHFTPGVYTLVAHISATLPGSATNASETKSAQLSDIGVTITQTDSHS